MRIDYSKIPESAMESLDAYVRHGRPLGGCMEAVVSNDLMGAFCRADDEHIAAMFHIVGWLYNEAPANCHGSKEAYRAWIEDKWLQRQRPDHATEAAT